MRAREAVGAGAEPVSAAMISSKRAVRFSGCRGLADGPHRGGNGMLYVADTHTLFATPLAPAFDRGARRMELDFLKAQLARLPTRNEMARIALGVISGAARAGHRID